MSFVRNFRARLESLRERERFCFAPEELPADFRRAAVLLPFWAEGGDVRVLLTHRAASLSSHAGQTAFPGGSLDPGETWTEAALREAHEEVGIPPESVEVLGMLDDAWSRAGHHIVPVVGWLAEPPEPRPNAAEVAEVLVAPVSQLLREESRSEKEFVRDGRRYTNTTLSWDGGNVFGLSADLLLEALAWGTGDTPNRGPRRLADLRTMYRPTSWIGRAV